jgi:dolichol kinase
MLSDLLGAGILLLYYLITCFIIPTLLKGWVGVPNELARKFQHVAYALSVFILLEMFSSWYIAIAAAFLLVLVAYPVLMVLEKSSFYKKCLTDRTSRGGELRKQMLYVQLSFAILIFLFWGLHGTKWQYVIAVAVMAWGFGDAAAALVGKAFGRHRIIHSLVEGAKTLEGTSAMIVFATLASFITLLFYVDLSWYLSLLISAIVGSACGVVELFSRRGLDTLTVPLTAAVLTMPLVYVFSLTGW